MKKVFSFVIDFSSIEETIIEAARRQTLEGEEKINLSEIYPAFIYFVVQQLEKKIEEIESDLEGCLYRNSQSYVKGIFYEAFLDDIEKRINDYKKHLEN